MLDSDMWIMAVEQIRNTTGFTLHPHTGFYAGNGYSVCPYPTRSNTVDLENASDLQLTQTLTDYMASNSDLLDLPNHYVGAWHPGADAEQLVLDIAVITSSRAQAEIMRVKYGQEDFYDFAAGLSRPHNIRNLIGGAR